MDISSGTPLYVGNGNGAMGGDWGIMFLAFLAMLGGGFGGFGRGPMGPITGDQAPASSAQLQNSMNFFSEMINAQNMMIVAENQKTRDMFTQDRFDRMQAEINELKRQRDLAGLRDSLRPLPPPFSMAAGF